MSGSYIILKKHSQDSRRIRPFPPDEDFNWVIFAIFIVGMMIASANFWQFFHGGFPDPTATKHSDHSETNIQKDGGGNE